MDPRPRLQIGLTSLVAALIPLFTVVCERANLEEIRGQILLKHPLARLHWDTWRMIQGANPRVTS
jgi:hypothetical protein